MIPTNTNSMKAIRFHEYGGFDVLKYEDVPCPEPQQGEVLIQVHAASVNPFDLALREGWLASMIPLQLPAISGVDVAGRVVATATFTGGCCQIQCSSSICGSTAIIYPLKRIDCPVGQRTAQGAC